MNSVSHTTTAVLQQTRPHVARVSAQATASFLLLVLLGVLAKGVGLVREMVLAAQFGASGPMDAYLVAQTLPSAVQRVFDELLGASLLPLFAGWVVAAGEAAAWARLKSLLRFLLWSSALLVLVSLPLAGPLARALAPGLGLSETSMAARALLILLPGIAFGVAGSIFAAMLNYHRRFVCAALFALAGNALALACILLFAGRIGIYSAAAGVTAGALLLVLQWFFLPAAGRREPSVSTTAATRAEFWRLAGPLAAGIALFNAAPLIQNFLASSLPQGSIALLNYAFKVDWLVYLVLVVPITTMAFPRMADAGAAGDTQRFLGTLHLALKGAFLALLPAMIFLGIAAPAVIALLYERGSFTTVHTAGTAAILRVYLFGLPGAAATLILFYALYALNLPAVRLTAGALMALIYGIGGTLAARFLGTRGLALTHVVSFVALLVCLNAYLCLPLGRGWWRPLWPFAARATAAAGLTCLLMVLALRLMAFSSIGISPALRCAWLVLWGAATAGVFLLLCWLLRLAELRSLASELKRYWAAYAMRRAGGIL